MLDQVVGDVMQGGNGSVMGMDVIHVVGDAGFDTGGEVGDGLPEGLLDRTVALGGRGAVDPPVSWGAGVVGQDLPEAAALTQVWLDQQMGAYAPVIRARGDASLFIEGESGRFEVCAVLDRRPVGGCVQRGSLFCLNSAGESATSVSPHRLIRRSWSPANQRGWRCGGLSVGRTAFGRS